MVPACALFCEGSFGRSTCITMGTCAKGKDPMVRQEDRKGDRGKAYVSTTLKRENTFTLSPSLISPESDASGGLTTFYFAPRLQFLSLSHQSAGTKLPGHRFRSKHMTWVLHLLKVGFDVFMTFFKNI